MATATAAGSYVAGAAAPKTATASGSYAAAAVVVVPKTATASGSYRAAARSASASGSYVAYTAAGLYRRTGPTSVVRPALYLRTGATAVAKIGATSTATLAAPVAGMNLSLDFDTAERQGLSAPGSNYQIAQAHQKSWRTDLTRLGAGHSERFEIHNDPGDIVNGQAYRSMMDVLDTNEGGDSVNGATGYGDVYWCLSTFWPTQAVTPSQATVSPGFAQAQAPAYQMFFEIHERSNINGSTVGINNVNEVSLLSLMIRRTNVNDPASAQLQFRGCAGTWSWNAGTSSWDKPSWSTGTPSTTGKNDQIPIPIVKPGGTNPAMLTDAWLDMIFHVRFAKDSTGLVEIWARQAGQAFTTGPSLSISGPTHKVVIGSDGVTRSSADYEPATGYTGSYAHLGLYAGSTTWDDTSNGANVALFDEVRRYGTLAEARSNWGGA